MIRPPSIAAEERRRRVERLCARMEAEGLAAVLVGSSSSLRYFAGFDWERRNA